MMVDNDTENHNNMIMTSSNDSQVLRNGNFRNDPDSAEMTLSQRQNRVLWNGNFRNDPDSAKMTLSQRQNRVLRNGNFRNWTFRYGHSPKRNFPKSHIGKIHIGEKPYRKTAISEGSHYGDQPCRKISVSGNACFGKQPYRKIVPRFLNNDLASCLAFGGFT